MLQFGPQAPKLGPQTPQHGPQAKAKAVCNTVLLARNYDATKDATSGNGMPRDKIHQFRLVTIS